MLHILKHATSTIPLLSTIVCLYLLSIPSTSLAMPDHGHKGGSACQSADIEEKKYKHEKESLGLRHADEHARTRFFQCQVERGVRKASHKHKVKPAEQTLKDDEEIKQAILKKNVQFDARGRAGGSALGIVGSPTAVAALAVGAPDPVKMGRWSDPFVIPVVGVTAVLLHTGNVLFWSYDPVDYHNPANSKNGVAFVWNPATRQGYNIPPPENIWCGGQTILSDGRVYVAGGNLRYPDPNAPAGTGDWAGTLTNFTFNPLNNLWARQPDMKRGRWYPTVTKLADNRVVITSGMDETGTGGITNQVEVFTPDPNMMGIGTLTAKSIHDSSGLYPLQFLLPSGKMLEAGPNAASSFQLDPANWSWTGLPRMKNNHYYLGNGVSYSDAAVTPAKQTIMVAGGHTEILPQAANEWLDGFNPMLGWQTFPAWKIPRHNANTVILPDGKLFTVGGNKGLYGYEDAVFTPEMYSTTTSDKNGTWLPMAPHSVQAAYHSTALLLPDATVLLSQDDMDYSVQASLQHKAQVYFPPYLFKGAQPKIVSVPDRLSYGQSFSVVTDRGGMTSAMLIAPAATTHGNDMHQRAIKLKITVTSDGLIAAVPASRALVPPGYYMLFVTDSAGIPSVAKFVQVT